MSGNEKIDPFDRSKKIGFHSFFVRMSDQLITRAGEYERLSVAYSENSRSENHQQVLTSLQKKARDSWELVSEKTSKLSEEGKVRNLKKFWIINGFSCLAINSAIEELAGHTEISYIYLDLFSKPIRRSSPLEKKIS